MICSFIYSTFLFGENCPTVFLHFNYFMIHFLLIPKNLVEEGCCILKVICRICSKRCEIEGGKYVCTESTCWSISGLVLFLENSFFPSNIFRKKVEAVCESIFTVFIKQKQQKSSFWLANINTFRMHKGNFFWHDMHAFCHGMGRMQP